MNFDKQFALSLGISAAVAIAAEVFFYSISESKKDGLKIAIPNKSRSLEFAGGSILTGLLAAFFIQKIQDGTMTQEAKDLTALYNAEMQKLKAGSYKGNKPIEVVWQPLTTTVAA